MYENPEKDLVKFEEEEQIVEDESIYSEQVRDQMLEDDELSPYEAAFMEGYEEASV